jgi:hypothetical protein
MVEYRRKEEAEEKKERNMGKEKKWTRLYNQRSTTCKAVCGCLYFYHITAFILSSPH